MGRRRHPGVEVHGGLIRIDFQYRGRRCRETLGLPPTNANLKSAARTRAQIQAEIQSGVFNYAAWFPSSPNADKSNVPTFGELVDRWLALQTHAAKSTLTSYRGILKRYFRPRLGSRLITDIRYSEVAEVVAEIPWGSSKTRNNALTPLRGVFQLAVRDRLIAENPAAWIEREAVQAPEPDPLNLDEVNAVVGSLKEPYKNYFEFAFFTGMRTSELIALKWSQVDLENGSVCVDRAKVEGEIKVTKTAKIRHVELLSRAKAALERQRSLTGANRAEVFFDPITDQAIVNDKPPRLIWDRTLRKLNIRKRVAYQTRHTFATLALMSGANPMWVARQLGHSTVSTTYRKYARWIDGADQSRERNKVEQFMSESWGKSGANLGANPGTEGDNP